MNGVAVATTDQPLSKAEAQELTTRIRDGFEDAYDRYKSVGRLLLHVRDHQGWAAMGYESWSAYLNTEFPKGRSQAYRLMDRVLLEDALEVSVGQPVPVTEGQARVLKPRLSQVAKEVRARIDAAPAGQGAAIAQAAVAEEATKARQSSRRKPEVIDVPSRPGTRPPDVIADRDPDDILSPELEPAYAPAPVVEPEPIPAPPPAPLHGQGYSFERLVEVIDWLAGLPDPEEIARSIPEGESYQLSRVTTAYRWVCDFADAWDER